MCELKTRYKLRKERYDTARTTNRINIFSAKLTITLRKANITNDPSPNPHVTLGSPGTTQRGARGATPQLGADKQGCCHAPTSIQQGWENGGNLTFSQQPTPKKNPEKITGEMQNYGTNRGKTFPVYYITYYLLL